MASGFAHSWYPVALPLVLAGIFWPIGRLVASVADLPGNARIWGLASDGVRLAVVVSLAFVADRSDRYGDDAMIRAIVVCGAIYAFSTAISSAASNDLAARAIPARDGEAFFRLRGLIGAIGGILVALVGGSILTAPAMPFPDNFAIVFIAAAILLTAGAFLRFIWTPDVRPTIRSGRPRVAPAGTRLATTYLTYRFFTGAAALIDPFLIIYLLRNLDPEPRLVGIVVAIMIGFRAVSAVGWEIMGRRGGVRTGLQIVAVIRVLVALLALALPHLYGSTLWSDHVSGTGPAVWTFLVVFACVGIVHGGEARLAFIYPAQLGLTADRRWQAIATAVGIVAAVTPLVGAWVFTRWGWDEVAIAAAGAGLLGVIASGALVNLSGVVRPRSGSWPLRRARSRSSTQPGPRSGQAHQSPVSVSTPRGGRP